MNDEEGALARWSRRKREAKEDKKLVSQIPQVEGERKPTIGDADVGSPARPLVAEQAPFDPATLPPIESIVAGTDIRAFLQSGVPMELTKAALRRAWTTDPAIREFIEIAENQWDFTNPATIPGFGPLQAEDDVGRLVTQAMGKWAEANSTTASAEAPASTSASSTRNPQVPGIPKQSEVTMVAAEQVDPEHEPAFAASQHVEPQSPTLSPPYRRGHGRALPK
jgi:Protein of unknown function (DUF3306)